jgi:uridine kinase
MRRREKIKLAKLCHAVLLEGIFADDPKHLEDAMISLELQTHKFVCEKRRKKNKNWGISRRKIADMLTAYQKSIERGESPAVASRKAFDADYYKRAEK